MASVEELQDELVRQSSRRLEAEHERTRLEEQVRKLARENQTLREENAVQTQRVEEMENEMADLSSSLVEQANVRVAEANRKVAAAQRMVEERDTLLEIQSSELQEIKRMMAQQEEARSAQRVPKRARRPSFKGKLDADAILDLDSYASPVRPMLRTDTREFRDFLEIFPAEGAARSFHFSLEALEAPAWRRSRFVTKLIQEDIEPALRLDRAAHMNWLTCRAFLTALLEQTLILEPVSAKERPWAHRPSHPCLLCGENRAELIYSRYFWARTTAEAEPLVLDLACLAKVRLACELVGFVRSITDAKPGHTREQQEQAWQECSSLREQLFWCRVGGLYPESGETVDAEEAMEEGGTHELEKMPDSARNTPMLAQSGFSVESPAATISSAVLRRAVPPQRTENNEVGIAYSELEVQTRTDNLELNDGAAESAEQSENHSSQRASHNHGNGPQDAANQFNEGSRRARDLSASSPEHAQKQALHSTELPSHSAGTQSVNSTDTSTAKSTRPGTPDRPTGSDPASRSPITGAVESGLSRSESVEFNFDDDEFHSPGATPEQTPGTTRAVSPATEQTHGEAMPGGWPG